MMTIQQWLQRNVTRPLLAVIILLLTIQAGYVASLFVLNRRDQMESVNRLRDVITIALQQNNRPLLESSMSVLIHDLHASHAAICRSGRVLISIPSFPPTCQSREAKMLTFHYYTPLSGFDQHGLYLELPLFPYLLTFLGVLTSWFFLTATILLVSRRVRIRANREIIRPLVQTVDGSDGLRIYELETLRQRNKEYQILRAKSAVSEALENMATKVAHDIRSPLGALDSLLEVLKISDHEALQLVRQCKDRIHGIASELLVQYRRAGAVQPSWSVIPTIQSILEEKQVEYRNLSGIHLTLDPHTEVNGSYPKIPINQFRSVMSNLINNAVEAIEGEGAVTVRVSQEEPKTCVVSVVDTGKGIPSKFLPKLTERGFTHGKSNGTGLGLYYARQLMEDFGGKIQISSACGVGTSVMLRIPLFESSPDHHSC